MRNSRNNKFGLPREKILRGKHNFDRIFRHGKRLTGRTVDLKYILVDSEDGGCLAGFITGKRLGKAVHRNKIRRRLREVYRLHAHTIDDLLPVRDRQLHIVLIAKTIKASYADIQQDVETLFAELRNKLQ